MRHLQSAAPKRTLVYAAFTKRLNIDCGSAKTDANVANVALMEKTVKREYSY